MTEFDPVTFPIAASAVFSYLAAVIDANVSGSDVPKATNVMALIGGGIPKTHPNTVAIYSTSHVTNPIIPKEAKNVAHP